MRSGHLQSSLGEVFTDIFGPVKRAAGGAGTLAGSKSTVTGTREFVEREKENLMMKLRMKKKSMMKIRMMKTRTMMMTWA